MVRTIMKASEMVTAARLASHYEGRGVDNPLDSAQHDIRKFKREAPHLWAQLQDSSMSDRAIGDWVYSFLDRWTRSGMSFKNFVERENDATPNPRRKSPYRSRSHELEFAGHRFTAGPQGTVIHRELIDTGAAGDYGADPLGDGTFRMVPSGDIVDFEERNRRLKRYQRNRAHRRGAPE